MAPPAVLLLALALLGACSRGPSRDEALAAIRAAQPGVEGATVTGRVWQDGPPWFSCAEVSAKIRSGVDSAVVRGQLGNWRDLAGAGWMTLRDTAAGAVVDPGWCALRPTAAGAPAVARWAPTPGPEFPTGQARRGWTMPVGSRAIAVDRAPERAGDDAAVAEYLVVIRPNDDGRAVGAARDTTRYLADLRRVGGRWRVTTIRRAPPDGDR